MTEPAEAAPRNHALTFIFATIFLDIVGIGIVIPNSPQLVAQLYGGDMSSSALVIGLLGTLYTAMQFFLGPALGTLSDQIGRKPVLLMALLCSTLSYLGAGWAPTLVLLLICRSLGGVGGASLTVATTYIADVTPPEKRASAFGLVGVAFGLGFIAGPALGGLLGTYGLRLPFFAAAIVSGLNMLYGLLAVPESLPPEKRGKFDWSACNPLKSLGRLGKYSLVQGLAIAMLWFGMAQQFLQNNWVLYTTYRFAWTPGTVGASLAVVGIGAALVQGGLIRVVLPRLGERRAVLVGIVIHATSLLLYGLAFQGWMMFAILVLSSFGGIAGPALQAQMSKQVPPQEQGAVQGALSSLQSLMGIFGPLLANGIFGFFTGPHAPVKVPGSAMLAGAMLSVISLFVTLRVFARNPETELEAPVPASV